MTEFQLLYRPSGKVAPLNEDPQISFKIRTTNRLPGSEYPVNKITTGVNKVISIR